MILSLQTDTFGSFGGIPTYNRLVCRVFNDFDLSERSTVLIAMDKQEDVIRQTTVHPNLQLAGFGGNRVQFVRAALRAVLRNHIKLMLAGHVNYAPLCLFLKLFRPRMRYGVLIYGWDVWGRIPPLRRWALQQADFIISISEYTKRQAVSINGIDEKRIFVSPNALEWETTEICSSTKNCSLPPGVKILSVGRLESSEQEKGFDTVIESLPNIVARVPTVQYIVVGSGTDLERHKRLAKEFGVSDRVHFLGSVEDKTLRSCYESCDVFVMPSAQEGFGFVYLEAMQYGKPVVAARSGGVREVVKDGETGVLVEYGNKEELAQVLTDLCLDPEKRRKLGSAGYRRLQENFTFAHFKERLTDILIRELPRQTLAADTRSHLSTTSRSS